MPWPAGIPKKYSESDLLQGQELLTYAMNLVKKNELEPNGYKSVSSIEQLDKIPNFICEKDGETFFIVVKASISPEKAKMSLEEKKYVLEYAMTLDAKCLFAPVEIGSFDTERFAASLALKNDRFLISYIGLEKISFKKSIEWINSTLAEIKKLEPATQVVKEDAVRYSISEGDYDSWKNSFKSETFQELLLKYIEMKGMSNSEFYNAALIDRKLFSAIKNNPSYKPKKDTAVACCLGLGLNLQESEKLLEVAGYKLSLSISWDRVIYYCLNHGITDIDVVNELLSAEGDKCIRV